MKSRTNLTLSTSAGVVYTHHAHCQTETPTTFIRWVVQQTRWSKSFYREALFSAKFFHYHPIWLGYEIVYQGLYPFILLYSSLAILFLGKLELVVIWGVTLLGVGILKGLFGAFMTGEIRFGFVPFYGFMYLFVSIL